MKLYLEQRRRGTEKIPPENITDESPLIRAYTKEVKPLTEAQIHEIVHKLYVKARLCSKIGGSRYDLRPHSLQKHSKTQLAALKIHNKMNARRAGFEPARPNRATGLPS